VLTQDDLEVDFLRPLLSMVKNRLFLPESSDQHVDGVDHEIVSVVV
jgi:hypothetical protein